MVCWYLMNSESEYAAWTLVNGYALNHVTISTHRLKTHLKEIKKLNQFIKDSGFRLNSEGGVLKGLYPCFLLCNYKVFKVFFLPK